MLNKTVQDYLEYCKISHKSFKTVENYAHYLKRFAEFVGDIPLSSITLGVVNTFRAKLYEDNLSVNTQNYHLVCLRAFLRYCLLHDMPTLIPEKIALLKHEKPITEYLTGIEIKRFFKVIPSKTVIDKRDKALLTTLYTGALRISELTGIDRTSIDLENKEIVVRGKGKKPRTVFICSETAQCIKEYLETRQDQYKSLFLSYRNQSKDHRISNVMCEYIVRKYAKKAGISKKVTPHTLRRSFATGLIIDGAPMAGVQEILGHSWITTTQIYTSFSRPDLKKIHEKHLRSFI